MRDGGMYVKGNFGKRFSCAVLILAGFVLFSGAAASAFSSAGAWLGDAPGGESKYVENEWNFVDGAMDVSEGIPEDAEGVLEKIRAAGKLRVATEPYFPPQEFIDPNQTGQDRFVGSDMELAKLIAERMGVKLEIVPMEFTDVLPAVADGLCDLAISGLAFTPQRAAMVELSKGYYYSEEPTGCGVLIRAADAETITGVEDLKDKTLFAQRGSLQETMMAEHVQFYREFRRVNSVQELYSAVQNGRADAAAVDAENALLYIQNNPDCGLMLSPDMYFTLKEQFTGDRIAGAKGELQLMYFVNGVINELLKTGQYDDWFRRYEVYAEWLKE